ncbi:hypothetical protein PP742_gp19 [Alcaligenes phage vB_Af_QDWS595]|uniref:Uncharacterized protein n=1 Tax=Alcaligenes phage vB_Af_QDWS595 TaxID=2877946 RepID=A0AAE9C0G9_9CAUD|nr:hypothetical protein PP742_gp19 [Alcaligenes phage vB_Af_QDWS595]UCR75503.1 hypothetical protein vBAfaPQDWS595_19 [Alcaligenes phage vB_Af_QDWS595]
MQNKDLENMLGGSDKPEELDELTVLKQRAQLMGIEFSNNIGIDTLRKRIQEHTEGNNETAPQATEPAVPVPPLVPPEPKANTPISGAAVGQVVDVSKLTPRQQAILEAKKLVRVRIRCHNPTKQDLQGELICVANNVIGEVKRMVPYASEFNEDGWHIEQCILDMLKERKYLSVRVVRKKGTNETEVIKQWVPEFTFEYLEPLNQAELRELARRQEATGSING